ncbi:MAG: MoaD/ThiS family protein [Gammaproteobacteria bacterium]|nr:MoaD/ThiS family protein [Gammaproteobacteria bacterium]
MLKVLFFARVREELGCAGLDLAWGENVASLDALQAQLCRDGGRRWQHVLAQPNMIRAVNQVVASGNATLSDGDEVAFFPPVTGG